jgi:signal transduction histidine kinase
VLGKSFSAFVVNPHDRQALLNRVREFGYVADYEILLKRTDGGTVFCLETAYAIRDTGGRIVEMQGIIKDITERIQTEKSLWKMNLELAEANLKIKRTQTLLVQSEKLASIGQLAAGIAHEINNPLSFLKSNHEMFGKYIKKIREASGAQDAASTASLFDEIDTMLVESADGFARIMHIIGSLKSFSRTEQGSDFGIYNVNEGIESTLVIARNEIKYVADVRKDLGDVPPIRARSGEINQVILNLLVNAAQAIQEQKRPEKGTIEIKTYASGEHVGIEIRDDGPGIPESLHMKIFDPFFTTKAPGKGTGLGLSISYDIIAVKHGGRLGVRSAPGAGTTFTIELPVNGPTVPEGSKPPDVIERQVEQ